MALKGTPGELMNILLRSSPEISPKIPTFKKEIKASRQKTQLELSLWGAACAVPFALFSPPPQQARLS